MMRKRKIEERATSAEQPCLCTREGAEALLRESQQQTRDALDFMAREATEHLQEANSSLQKLAMRQREAAKACAARQMTRHMTRPMPQTPQTPRTQTPKRLMPARVLLQTVGAAARTPIAGNVWSQHRRDSISRCVSRAVTLAVTRAEHRQG